MNLLIIWFLSQKKRTNQTFLTFSVTIYHNHRGGAGNEGSPTSSLPTFCSMKDRQKCQENIYNWWLRWLMCRYRRGRSLERRKTKQDGTTKYIWIKESQCTPVLFNQFLFFNLTKHMNLRHELFFPSVQLTISPILKTKEKKIIYTSFFYIYKNKIKYND